MKAYIADPVTAVPNSSGDYDLAEKIASKWEAVKELSR